MAAQFIGLHFLSLRGSRSNLVKGYEIAMHLSGARNDSGKLLDESGDYKNLEVKYEDNT